VASEKVRDRFDRSARDAAPDDFLRQIKRTVAGEPVDDAQVALLIDAIVDGLTLASDDVLLDLCCGNGALTDRLFARCRGGVGVDFSNELIAVARTHFERPPGRTYLARDVEAYLATADPTPFTKALCSFSFQYLSPASALRVLASIHERFGRIATIVLADLPDKARMHAFFYPGVYVAGMEDDYESDIGMWRTPDELRALAATAGWDCEIRYMPAAYHAAHYRFNAVLARR